MFATMLQILLCLHTHIFISISGGYKNADATKCQSPDTLNSFLEGTNPKTCRLNAHTSEEGKTVNSWSGVWLLKPGKILYRAQATDNKVSPRDPGTKEKYGAWFATTAKHAKIHIKEGQEVLAAYKVGANIHVFYKHNLDGTGYDYIDVRLAKGSPNPFDSPFAKEVKASGTPIQGYIGCNECEVYLNWHIIDIALDKLAKKQKKGVKKLNANPGKGFAIKIGDGKANDELFGDEYPTNAQQLEAYVPYDAYSRHIDSNYVHVNMEYELLFGLGMIGIIGFILLFCCILIASIIIGSGILALYFKSESKNITNYDEINNV